MCCTEIVMKNEIVLKRRKRMQIETRAFLFCVSLVLFVLDTHTCWYIVFVFSHRVCRAAYNGAVYRTFQANACPHRSSPKRICTEIEMNMEMNCNDDVMFEIELNWIELSWIMCWLYCTDEEKICYDIWKLKWSKKLITHTHTHNRMNTHVRTGSEALLRLFVSLALTLSLILILWCIDVVEVRLSLFMVFVFSHCDVIVAIDARHLLCTKEKKFFRQWAMSHVHPSYSTKWECTAIFAWLCFCFELIGLDTCKIK